MKRRKISCITVILLLCCILYGCAAAGGGQTTAEETQKTGDMTQNSADTEQRTAGKTMESAEKIPVLWPETEMPAALKYDRMWIYSAYAETEDPETIRDIVEAVRNIKVQEKEGSRAEDYTDILLFTFRDGHTYRLEFEADSWLADDDTCLHVEGLSPLRTILDGLLEKDAENANPKKD